MHTQYFIINQCCHWELFKHTHKLFKESAIFLIIASQGQLGLAFPFEEGFVETVYEGEVVAFVVASEEEKVFGVLYFESEQKQHRLYLHRSSALVVAQK